MTTIERRPATAVLVIDVQNAVVAGAHERAAVVANIAATVGKARTAGVPVIWVQHSDDDLVHGSPGWQIVPELEPAADEPLIHKRYGDSFEDTDLEAALAAAGAGRLVITGAQSDMCVRSTMHGAFTRGYDVTLVGDAHTTEDLTGWGAPTPDKVIAHTNLYWAGQRAPGRTAAVITTADLTFG
ncbi:isochorismatase family protein [Actinoplanes sp. N902-109]|uniref:isochorismatase family protein n=1 Tax=Actinoplanes sp. (strain N902-109) TaxID=649831 RepID=UPI00032965E9|nr:isochorismatase family protein [Actinoplanes sp. N902-109]AGL19285.1 isochorismatase hydrolase [Actinoplanes sp. N902-109]